MLLLPLGSEGYHLLSSVPIPEQFQHTICHPLPRQESPWANPVQAADGLSCEARNAENGEGEVD